MAILRLAARIWTVLLGVALVLVVVGLALRWLLPTGRAADAPMVVAADPSPGTRDVPLRAEVRLRFNQEMNRSSVERALRFDPPVVGRFLWDSQRHELVVSPAVQLAADITYTVQLNNAALGRLYVPLATPFSWSFHTAPAPVVLAALPDDTSVPITSSIALVFSRPMVPTDALHQAANVPHLRFEPPLQGEARWIDQTTLVFAPSTTLPPATTIRGSIDGALSDLSGTPLDQPFAWTFATAAPVLMNNSPAPGARNVGPHTPLVLSFSQALAPGEAARALSFSPPISVSITSAMSGTSEIVSAVPTGGWQPETTYDVQLGALRPAAGDRLLAPNRWSFTTAPPLTLVGRFPGQGQILPNGQSVRLIFASTVNTATLLSGLRLEPDAGPLGATSNGAEVRIQAAFQSNTAYTLTLDQTIVDTNGVPLDQRYQLHFVTAPTPPVLALPDATQRFLSVPADQIAAVNVRRTNVTALDMRLYRLDETTLVRLFGFTTINWRDFQPERYNLPQLRSWRVPLPTDPAGETIVSPFQISAQEPPAPLPPGAYYLRVRSPEGVASDLVLVVSRATLSLITGAQQSLVWASDTTGAALPNLPLTLYAGSSVASRGSTDANGLWRIDRPAGVGPYLVVAMSGQPANAAGAGAIVSSEWTLPSTRGVSSERGTYRIGLATDRTSYGPNSVIRVGGFVRAVAAGQIVAPALNTALALSVRRVGTTDVLTTTSVALDDRGVVAGSLPLQDAAPGSYVVRAVVGDTVRDLPVQIVAEAEQDVDVAFVAQDASSATVVATTRYGEPLRGATVQWRITGSVVADTPPAELFDTMTVGDDDEPLAAAIVQQGSGATDTNGAFAIPLPSANITQTTQLHIRAEVSEGGGVTASGTTRITIPASDLLIGIQTDAQAFVAPSTPRVELLAVERDGTPVAATTLQVDVVRRSWQPSFRATRVARHTVMTDEQGRATLTLDLRAADEYRVLVTGRGARSAQSIWVAPSAGAHTGWRSANGGILLVPDQQRYAPDTTAHLLVGLDQESTPALVAIERNGVLTATVRTLQANTLLDAAIPSGGPVGDATVTVLLPDHRVGRALVHVQQPVAPISVSIASELRPGSASDPLGHTLALTVTTQDNAAVPLRSDLLVAITDADTPFTMIDLAELMHAQRPGSPPIAQTTAITPAGVVQNDTQPAAGLHQRPPPAVDYAAIFWRAGVRTQADGTVRLGVPLPPGVTRWRITVLASGGATLFGEASAVVTTTQPLIIEPQTPFSFAIGDTGSVGFVARNTGASTATLSATLTTSQLGLNGQPFQVLRLAGQEAQFVSWTAIAREIGTAVLTFTVQTDNGLTQVITNSVAIRPSAVERSSETFVGPLRFTRPITASADKRPLRLEVAFASSYAAAIERSQQWLAMNTQRSIEQEASLLTLNALIFLTKRVSQTVAIRSTIDSTFDQLEAHQRPDGGWGWWPDSPSHPFMTAYVLESWAFAQHLGRDLPPQGRASALEYLQQQLRVANDPDLQSYLLYVLSLYGDDQSAAASSLIDRTTGRSLTADGLAYLALMLPPDKGSVALDRLAAIAQRSQAPSETATDAFWSVDDTGDIPRSSVSTTALVLRAFERGRPNSTLVVEARHWLLRSWGVDGWPTAYDSARVAAALNQATGPVLEPIRSASASATFDGRPLPLATGAITQATKLDLPLADRNATLAIDVQYNEQGDLPTLAYRLTASAPVSTMGNTTGIALTRSYHDPVSDMILDPTTLQHGQLVSVQLTLVVANTHTFLTLREPVSAGWTPLTAQPMGPFERVSFDTGELRWSATRLAAGVYTQRYLARVGLPGNYTLLPAFVAADYHPAFAAHGPAQRAIVR